jgi:hypothetical protein
MRRCPFAPVTDEITAFALPVTGRITAELSALRAAGSSRSAAVCFSAHAAAAPPDIKPSDRWLSGARRGGRPWNTPAAVRMHLTALLPE